MRTYEYDDDSVVVVVGSGAGGGTLADELSSRGIDVVVLEAGPRFRESDFENDEWMMWERLTWQDRRAVTGTSSIAKNHSEAPTWICKGVGGTTLHWAAMCPPLRPYEFKTLTTYGAVEGANLADWPVSYDEIEPDYVRAQIKMGVTGRNNMPLSPGSNNYKILALAARRQGYVDYDTGNLAINSVPADGRNACDQIGFCMQGCKSGAKWSTFNSEIPRAEKTGHCEVRPQCMVIRLETNQEGKVNQVIYVDKHGKIERQRARIVCVAANAIESSRLLLNSESSLYPNGLANSSGQVGKNYMRHVVGFIYGIFENPIHMYRGRVCDGLIRDEARNDESRGFVGGYFTGGVALGLPFFAAFLNPGAWGEDFARWMENYDHVGGIHFNGEDLAVESNQVSLHQTEKDQFGLPIPTLHLDDHPNDLSMRSYANLRSVDGLRSAGAIQVLKSPPTPASHNLGTCRMSVSAEKGVVNKWGQSHDVSNLFISDGSQFVSSTASNPTCLIVALAIRQSRYIGEQMAAGDL
ncbi:MAG: 2-keto-gluconate dehydrogenase [Myxococcales bacterium]|nr:2-keto-gluconate dehydrogenase [Myxococcales bacterium]